MRGLSRAVAMFLLVALTITVSGACSLGSGYFHQVTAIRGQVVGRNLGPLQFRWLRQLFCIGDATLILYEYSSHVDPQNRKTVAVIKTDSHGEFNFGAVARGHYSLVIDVPQTDGMGGWFDVEVTDTVAPTKDIIVDVSPIRPDCSGGHEFIEHKKS